MRKLRPLHQLLPFLLRQFLGWSPLDYNRTSGSFSKFSCPNGKSHDTELRAIPGTKSTPSVRIVVTTITSLDLSRSSPSPNGKSCNAELQAIPGTKINALIAHRGLPSIFPSAGSGDGRPWPRSMHLDLFRSLDLLQWQVSQRRAASHYQAKSQRPQHVVNTSLPPPPVGWSPTIARG